MHLYLMRHGESLSVEIDPKKSLSSDGVTDVKKIGKFLKKNLILPPEINIYHSTKLRTKQTATIISEYFPSTKKIEQLENLCPNDPLDQIFDRIQLEWEDILLVGHLPVLSKLTSKILLSNELLPVIDFSSASILSLIQENKEWVIEWFISPKNIN